MNRPTLGLAALLMLGGTTFALAQDDPRERAPGPEQGLERGVAPDMPGDDGPRAGDGPRGGAPDATRGEEGPRAEGPDPAARKGPPEGEPSGAERKTGSAKKDRDDAPGEARESRRKSAEDDEGADRKARKQTGARDDDGREREGKTKRDAKAKPDRERGDRRSRDTDDAAEAEKARPDDRDDASDRKKQAGTGKQDEGDRTPAEQARKADLSGEKRERVTSAFREGRDVRRRTDVDIDISIGTRLPRDWDFVPVPAAVIDVVPEYRGYVFAYVDDEYVICDPVTYEVVAVLPAADGPRYAGGGGGGKAARCSETLTLTEDERDILVRSIEMTDEVDVSDITVGWSVPGDIELRTFPDPVIERTGKLASCRYFLADDQIAIVDPAEETVVLLVEHDD
mgnify:CR=1 FL=1